MLTYRGAEISFKAGCAVCAAVAVVLLVPFLNKAFHVDDTLFLWTGQQILTDPCDFYGFSVNWYGHEAPMAEITKNPPVCSYFIALIGLLAGWNEIVLHGAFLLFAVLFTVGTYFLAAVFCSRPLIATLAAVVSPVFLVSSTNIMCDTMMLAFWVWALSLWVLGTFIFAAFLNWTVNGRSVLPMIPAVGILLVRRMEHSVNSLFRVNDHTAALPLVPAACLALFVCLADCLLADSARTAAQTLHSRFAGNQKTVWFQGHWGFQYYMQAAGCKPIELGKSRIGRNDVIIVPSNNTNIYRMPKDTYTLDTTFTFSPLRWLTTISKKLSAGFFSDRWGPLPFVFGPVDAEKYKVYTVKQ